MAFIRWQGVIQTDEASMICGRQLSIAENDLSVKRNQRPQEHLTFEFRRRPAHVLSWVMVSALALLVSVYDMRCSSHLRWVEFTVPGWAIIRFRFYRGPHRAKAFFGLIGLVKRTSEHKGGQKSWSPNRSSSVDGTTIFSVTSLIASK